MKVKYFVQLFYSKYLTSRHLLMYRERTRREAFPEVPSRAADALFCQSRNFRLMLLSHTHTRHVSFVCPYYARVVAKFSKFSALQSKFPSSISVCMFCQFLLKCRYAPRTRRNFCELSSSLPTIRHNLIAHRVALYGTRQFVALVKYKFAISGSIRCSWFAGNHPIKFFFSKKNWKTILKKKFYKKNWKTKF